MIFVDSKKHIEYHQNDLFTITTKKITTKTILALYVNETNQIVLTGPDELWLADFAVTLGADGVHSVRVELTTARVCEVTHVILRPALGCFASVVHSRCHIVRGVVGVLPAKHDHIAGAIMKGDGISWSTGDWGRETEK